MDTPRLLLPAPASGAPRAESWWARAVRRICPWWVRKVEQGESYVQSLVEKEQAITAKTLAEARHHDADADKAHAEADRLRAESRRIETENARNLLQLARELQTMMPERNGAQPVASVEEITRMIQKLSDSRDQRQQRLG